MTFYDILSLLLNKDGIGFDEYSNDITGKRFQSNHWPRIMLSKLLFRFFYISMSLFTQIVKFSTFSSTCLGLFSNFSLAKHDPPRPPHIRHFGDVEL
jgi:hypothetical protein